MHSFDFISGTEFRANLEADDREMDICFREGAWKSVHVLAGSIVEALLVDYLAATNSPPRPGKDPLKISLAEAVNICRSEKVISERTADLSSVVRSYRNLIHPGRTVRTQDDQPSANSAQIAVAVVSLIVDEIAKMRRGRFGLTAEQLLSKLQRDTGALNFLKHLLQDMTPENQQRLLIELIPSRYFELQEEVENPFYDGDTWATGNRLAHLRTAYKEIASLAAKEIREQVAQRFVTVLLEGDGDRVLEYANAFFSGEDLTYVPVDQRPIIIEYLISRMSAGPLTEEVISMVEGIESFLNLKNVIKWADPIIKTISLASASTGGKEAAHFYLLRAATRLSAPSAKVVGERLLVWENHYKSRGSTESASYLAQVRIQFDLETIPF